MTLPMWMMTLAAACALSAGCGDDDGGDDDSDQSGADAAPGTVDAGADPVDGGVTGALVLNEVFAGDTVDGTFTTDWIELVNNGGVSVDLSGYHLSDDPAEPMLGTFAEGTTLAPGAYLRVDIADVEPFAFKLKAGGEVLILSDPAGTELDRVEWGDGEAGSELETVSYGRLPDGTGPWQTLATPSPGAENGAE
jgi:hypothetical protein